MRVGASRSSWLAILAAPMNAVRDSDCRIFRGDKRALPHLKPRSRGSSETGVKSSTLLHSWELHARSRRNAKTLKGNSPWHTNQLWPLCSVDPRYVVAGEAQMGHRAMRAATSEANRAMDQSRDR